MSGESGRLELEGPVQLEPNLAALAHQQVGRGPAQARVYGSGNVAIANTTATAVVFNSERWDTGGFHSTSVSPSRLTAPTAGLYLIGAHLRLAASSVGIREAFLRVNGSTQIDYTGDDDPSAGNSVYMRLETLYRLAADDYVEVVVFQSSGGNLDVVAAGNTSPEFWIVRFGSYA